MKQKRTSKGVVLLHAHGQAAPGGRRSYIRFGTYKNKSAAMKAAHSHGLERARYAKPTEVKPTKFKDLYYLTAKKRKMRSSFGTPFRFGI